MSEHGPTPEKNKRRAAKARGRARSVGVVLLIASLVLWAGVLAVPFLPLSGAWKVGLGLALVIIAEVTFGVSALVLGREVVHRYRGRLDPRRWFGGKKRR